MNESIDPTCRIDIPAAAATGRSGLWATLREAIRGSSLDYTTVPICRGIFMLAVPMVLEMLMESVFAALAVAYSTLAVVSAVVFRRGKWKSKVV